MVSPTKTCEKLSNIIKCQAICRGWLSRKNNIYIKFKKLQQHFSDVIVGYHMINKTPIKETVWEEVNCDIVSDVCCITDEANGNHTSGKDNKFDKINVSNKSIKRKNNEISLSSYRLTTVCSDKNPGDVKEIIREIERRDASFQYYSILVRDEKKNSPIINYEWYVIPKDYYLYKIDTFTPMYGKIGKKKGDIVGWESKYCDIKFSMSSQLWYKFDIKHIEKYKVCSKEIDNSSKKINYSQIFKSYSNAI
jgi:hypothetical protein